MFKFIPSHLEDRAVCEILAGLALFLVVLLHTERLQRAKSKNAQNDNTFSIRCYLVAGSKNIKMSSKEPLWKLCQIEGNGNYWCKKKLKKWSERCPIVCYSKPIFSDRMEKWNKSVNWQNCEWECTTTGRSVEKIFVRVFLLSGFQP